MPDLDYIVERFRLASEDVRFEVRWASDAQLFVYLITNDDGVKQGSIHLLKGSFASLTGDCEDSVGVLEDKKLSADDDYWFVWGADIFNNYRNKGYGKQMYETAFKALKERHGPVYVGPHECHYNGDTSGAATRVWNSLKSKYPHEGNTFYLA